MKTNRRAGFLSQVDLPCSRDGRHILCGELLILLENQQFTTHTAPALTDWRTSVHDNVADPDYIAETYPQLHRQHRSIWVFEILLRPWVEKW